LKPGGKFKNKNKKKIERTRGRPLVNKIEKEKKRKTRGKGKRKTLSLRRLKQQHRCLELSSVSHDTATGLHHNTASLILAQRDAFFLLWARLVLAQPVYFLGQADSGPALPSGPGLAQKKIRELLSRDRPNSFWAKSGPVSWASPTQPT